MSTTLPNGLGSYGESGQGTVRSVGAPRIPVIMVAFEDLDFLPEDDATKIGRWLNEKGYNDEPYTVGSVADFFRDNSYGLFSPQFEIVARVTLSHPLAYYGAHSGSSNDARPQELVREAVNLAVQQNVDFHPFVDEKNVSIVGIIHAGPGEQEDFGYQFPGQSSDDYIWAHYRAMNMTVGGVSISSYIIMNESMRDFDKEGNVTNTTMTGIGTFCHEFCHALGLPDIYDINGATSGACNTPGLWDLMDYQFMLNGYRPPCLSAYERCCLGWIDIPELPLTEQDDFTLLPLDGSDDLALTYPSARKAYRISNPDNEKEYFILENRQPSNWHVDCMGSTLILGTGMLVWHIDYNSSSWAANSVNTSSDHPRVSVVPADGAWQRPSYGNDSFAGDLFPGVKNVTTFDKNCANFNDASLDVSLRYITETPEGLITFTTADHPTGLHSFFSGENDNTYYNFSGQRTTQGALLIKNGRKTLSLH